MDRSFDCRQRSKWSEPHFLTSKFLPNKSVVKVKIRKLFIRQTLFPPTRTAKFIACEEGVSVTKSLHKAFQLSNSKFPTVVKTKSSEHTLRGRFFDSGRKKRASQTSTNYSFFPGSSFAGHLRSSAWSSEPWYSVTVLVFLAMCFSTTSGYLCA